MKKEEHSFTNSLIHESSPYLLQHAHNPVTWQPWNDRSLDLAKKENKLLIISVGYSACHWCHVMEHESFEDEKVAEIMNRDFVNIKVDREERPDVDQVYMNAVQVMTGAGGWPMNVVALPDGRPVWGGTYFKKDQWMSALKQLARLYNEKPEQLYEYAEKLQKGLQQMQVIKIPESPRPFSRKFYAEILETWKPSLDYKNGGPSGAPKFMMPNNYQFLLRYGLQEKIPEVTAHVETTLAKMAYGGIYDHIGGGFSRYSVDEHWHIPHFEKMLYDNAQLVSLYSQAYKLYKNELYREVVYQSLNFVKEELTGPEYSFYSALDADSLNQAGKAEEGAYYAWEKEELQEILQEDFEIFAEFFNINSLGKWEKGHYVLIRTTPLEDVAEAFQLSEEELHHKKEKWLEILKSYRNRREKPGLDDKILTSWNALMLTGYVDAYTAFGEQEFLEMALQNADFIKKHQILENNRLWHNYKNGKSSINGYLEDYAFVIEAFIKLHEATFDPHWLLMAEELTNVCREDFSDADNLFFYFTSKEERQLIIRNLDLTDNVIPASNSVMAKNLLKLSRLLEKPEWEKRAENMLKAIQPQIKSYPRGYSNWLDLMLNFTHPFYEIAITGKRALQNNQKFFSHYHPNTIATGTPEPGELPLLKNRYKENQNLIYVCSHGKCEVPQTSISKALKLIKLV